MSRTDRILIVAMMLCISIMCLVASRQAVQNRKRLEALQVRLQNIEHLFSVFISESRSSDFASRTNRVPTSADAPGKGANSEVKRRAQRKSGHYPPAHDRRATGQ